MAKTDRLAGFFIILAGLYYAWNAFVLPVRADEAFIFLKSIGYSWQTIAPASLMEYLIKDNMVCIAQLYKQLRTIYIDEGLLNDEVELRETIIHELVHAFIMTYAIDHKEFRDEEFICEFIAVYGDDILKTANELMDYFYEE